MKRFITILLAIVVLVTATAVSVAAGELTGMSGSDLYYYRMENAFADAITTFEAVVKLPEGYTGDAGYIMGTHGYGEEFYNFRINTNGMPHLYIRDASYKHDEYKFNKVNIATGDWVHLAIVRNTEKGVMQCYVDGEYKQSLALSGGTFIKSNSPFAIGGDFTDLNLNYFKGEINSIKLYSDVRTAKEIKSDFTTVDNDNLIAYYDLSNITPVTNKVIKDKSGNGYDASCKEVWIDEEPVIEDFEYSMVVVGDQQYLNRLYGEVGDMDKMYEHIVEFGANSENKLSYVFNMGDITDKSTQAEWDRAVKGFDSLTAANIPHTFVRGNHDTMETYDANLTYEKYGKDIVDGTYANDMKNCYRKVEIGGVKYLILVLDYWVTDDILAWASNIVSQNLDYNVIVATHSYAVPSDYDNLQICTVDDAEDIDNSPYEVWEKFVSKHENISLVLCGHQLTKTVMTRTDVGNNGNIVTSMLVNPQGTDNDSMYKSGYEHGSGLVAHLYFSNGGRNVQIRYYSTVLQKWFRSESQYTVTLDVVGDDNLTFADFS